MGISNGVGYFSGKSDSVGYLQLATKLTMSLDFQLISLNMGALLKKGYPLSVLQMHTHQNMSDKVSFNAVSSKNRH